MSSRISSSDRCALQLREQGVGHAAALEDQAVGVGEHGALDRREARRRPPRRDRLHLLLAQPDVARRLAVLGEDELAAARPAGARLAELAQLRDRACARGLR